MFTPRRLPIGVRLSCSGWRPEIPRQYEYCTSEMPHDKKTEYRTAAIMSTAPPHEVREVVLRLVEEGTQTASTASRQHQHLTSYGCVHRAPSTSTTAVRRGNRTYWIKNKMR